MGRKPQERVMFRARVAPDTPEKLRQLAASLGHLYGGEGQPGALLDLLASEDFVLVPKTDSESSATIADGIAQPNPLI